MKGHHSHPITMAILALAAASTLIGQTSDAQAIPPQTDTFNSTFSLTAAQIASLNLTKATAESINVAVRFEQSNWATGSVLSDPFYTHLPANASHAPAGSLLRLEPFADTSAYTIAPTLALSRIVFQSKTLNDTLVPASAYILWPYLPRYGSAEVPLVSWAHGTSGVYPECGPSHIRNLWYQFSAPYELALSGFAVVAPDYAGTGVSKYPDGSPIVNQYDASPAAGNDMLYAAQAAQAAFPGKLTKAFVAMGHSQGGGAAWGAAQQQLKAKVPGYLGAIAGSPVTSALAVAKAEGSSLGLIQNANSVISVFPSVKLSDILTPEGITAANVLEEIQACNSATDTLLKELFLANPNTTLTKDAYLNSISGNAYQNLTTVGGKDYQGPLLVIQGTADPTIPPALTTSFVNQTCQKYPQKELLYVKAKGIGHVPVMYATQQIWLSWLDERFGAADHAKGYAASGYSADRRSASSCEGERRMEAAARRPWGPLRRDRWLSIKGT
jgi:pimeloyl-ACP methyl ester carboxylesterase